LFGTLAEDVEELRHQHFYGKFEVDPDLQKVFEAMRNGTFGNADSFHPLINGITEHGDHYLVSDDFHSYLETHKLIDEAFRDQEGWTTKCITAVSRMGFFTSE